MYSIKVDQLVASMLQASQGALAHKWPEVKVYAESQFRRIGEAIALIEAQRARNAMSEERARMHLEMQKNTASSVLLTLEGLSAIAVETAINAALDVVKSTVNTALGFVLI